MEWMRQRKCAGAEPDLFFPGKPPESYAPAKVYCDSCPVRNDCLEYELSAMLAADDWWSTHGMFGGTTPNERRRILAGRGHRQVVAA